MFAKDYLSLTQDDGSDESQSTRRRTSKRVWRAAVPTTLALVLLTSIALNFFSCSRLLNLSRSRDGSTKFAGLAWDTPHVIEYHSRFSDSDRDVEDAAWASELVDPTTLVVALEDSFTESHGVMHSMRWPWDPHKGVYTLNSAHELHCLHLLRKTVNQAYDGVPLEWPRSHTAHCLEYLLQSVMCNADDTLLYQGRLHRNRHAAHPIGGLGDTRQCRNWDQLQTWAKQHSACYNPYYKAEDATMSEHERYKFCPDGSKPWESI